MIGKQRPSITACAALVYDCAQFFQEVVTIVVVPKNIAFFDSSGNDMVHGPRSINAGFSRHGLLISYVRYKMKLPAASGRGIQKIIINFKTEGRPHFCIWLM